MTRKPRPPPTDGPATAAGWDAIGEGPPLEEDDDEAGHVPVSHARSRPRSRWAIEDAQSVSIEDILDHKYQLLQPLDEGGMGSVYVGHNMVLGIPVAIKVIRADLKGPAKAKLAARLLQEAHAAARVTHPAIVRMMDLGTAPNGDPYLVMELLRGDDLATVLEQRGDVPPIEAVRILLPIAHGLAAAHDKKIVHRDLKPENIILHETEGGGLQPKLIDFGLAKTKVPRRKRLTRAGDAFGTPDYMSPEQVRGEDVTAQADIWAFSVLLYELITGRAPFEGNTFQIILKRILNADAVPTTDLGAGDDELWAIISKGMARDTASRWASMRELGAALASWLLRQGVREDLSGSSVEAVWLQPSSPAALNGFSSMPPPPEGEPVEVVLPASAPAALPGPAPQPAPAVAPAPAPPPPPPPAAAPVAPAPTPAATLPLPASPGASPPSTTADDRAAAAAAPAATAAPPKRSGWLGTLLLLLLWPAALTGIAGAVTGYLQVTVPGIPPVWTPPASWNLPYSELPWLRPSATARPEPGSPGSRGASE